LNDFLRTEKELLIALKNDDSRAYKQIYMTYYQGLCVYINSYTNNIQTSEDIVQNVLLKVWEERDRIQVHSSIKSYLYKSAYYSFIDFYRKKKTFNKKLESLRYKILNDLLEEEVGLKEKRLIALRKAIDNLPSKCKEIFVLSKFDGLKYKEIAETLDISINTVENQIGKALKTLREKMVDARYLNLFISFFFRSKQV